jgi:nitroreductase
MLMNVIDAIQNRISTRAFLSKEVPQELISGILSIASWAPSSKNTQPWEVAVVMGETKQKISDALLEHFRNKVESKPDIREEAKLEGKYRERAFACGMALYSALKIERGDKAKRIAQWEDNYHFFGAPVGLFFFTEKSLWDAAILDCGMFIQNVMLAAEEFGLATCPQHSVGDYPQIVKDILGDTYQNKVLLTGMSLGYPDINAPVNNYRTERADLDEFVRFFD